MIVCRLPGRMAQKLMYILLGQLRTLRPGSCILSYSSLSRSAALQLVKFLVTNNTTMADHNSCCCGVNLKKGCIIWAAIYTILDVISIAYCIFYLSHYWEHPGLRPVPPYDLILYYVSLAVAIVDGVFNAVLIHAVNKGMFRRCRLWVGWEIGKLIFSILCTFTYLLLIHARWPVWATAGFIHVVGLIIPVYIIVIVRRLACQMEKDQQRSFTRPV